MPTILSIDVGTQSVRSMLFDEKGAMLGCAKTAFRPYDAPKPGWAEINADYFWNAVRETCGALWDSVRAKPGNVAAVALTVQRATVVVTDARGAPLRPAIIWLDRRKAANPPPAGPLGEAAMQLPGMGKFIGDSRRRCFAHWIQENEPDVWCRTAKYLLLSGFLTHKITGRFVDSTGCQVGYLPFDYRKGRWARKDDLRHQIFRIGRDRLPDLAAPGERLGEATDAAAKILGVAAGTPVFAAASDQACDMLGAACLRPEYVCFSLGTTVTVKTFLRQYKEVDALMPPYPAAVPGRWHTERQIFRGFWAVSWFKEQFARELKDAPGGISPEEALSEEAALVPPGSAGLLVSPLWSPGVRQPGEEARGAIVGLREWHTRGHLFRALLEGLAFESRAGLDRITAKTRVPVKEIRAVGGGAKSGLMLQIAADVFDRPVRRFEVTEGSGLGAAICAAVGLGLHPGWEQAAAAMTHPMDAVRPDPHSAAVYDRLYREAYAELYDRLRPVYKRLIGMT